MHLWRARSWHCRAQPIKVHWSRTAYVPKGAAEMRSINESGPIESSGLWMSPVQCGVRWGARASLRCVGKRIHQRNLSRWTDQPCVGIECCRNSLLCLSGQNDRDLSADMGQIWKQIPFRPYWLMHVFCRLIRFLVLSRWLGETLTASLHQGSKEHSHASGTDP